MKRIEKKSLEERLDELFALQAARSREPDPFRILNITRTESPYTHFFAWLLDPTAAHPWQEQFLHELLNKAGQKIPPLKPIKFHVENHRFQKEPGDEIGFTCPDIVALSPNDTRPEWCLVIENKFDSKEGRASTNASQCATYQQRAKAAYGEIQYGFLFTTKTGERALGESDFVAISYGDIADTVHAVRQKLVAEGRWANSDCSDADRFAFYLVDSFLRHMKLALPDVEVRNALKNIARRQPTKGIEQAWIDSRPEILQLAARLAETIDRWDLATMESQIRSLGATDEEVMALQAIYNWGEEAGICDFKASQKSSFVIAIPTTGAEVQILAIQGRKIRFYWGHFIGGYDETKGPNSRSQKFPRAYELAEQYCRELNDAFGWDLKVVRTKNDVFDGFYEPSRPLSDVADPAVLKRFLEILSMIAMEAKGSGV